MFMTELVRIYLIGGFLGAGKTTAITAVAHYFQKQGRRVAVITNDQTSGLVDSEIVRKCGVPYREICGACICTQFRDFLETADTLLQDIRPEIILAEPTGSCLDLIATVQKPLRTYTQDRYRVMPFSVLVDPLRLKEILPVPSNQLASTNWPEDIRYLYDYQIREADHLVVTKVDTVTAEEMQNSLRFLREQYGTLKPRFPMHGISALTGYGLAEWMDALETNANLESTPLVFDAARYVGAESALGWVNLEAFARSPEGSNHDIDRVGLIQGFLQRFQERTQNQPIGHLKLFVESQTQSLKASMVDWRLGYSLDEWNSDSAEWKTPKKETRILINVRAVHDPQRLLQDTIQSLQEAATLQRVEIRISKQKAIHPGKQITLYQIGT